MGRTRFGVLWDNEGKLIVRSSQVGGAFLRPFKAPTHLWLSPSSGGNSPQDDTEDLSEAQGQQMPARLGP